MSRRIGLIIGFALAVGLIAVGWITTGESEAGKIKKTKTAFVILLNRIEGYKAKFRAYPTGTGAEGAPELVQALSMMEINVKGLIGKDLCPRNMTIQDAWGHPIRYYFNPSGRTVGGGYDALFQQNNCAPLLVSPGPNGTFDGGGDDIIVP